MVTKLIVQDNNQAKPFKPNIYPEKREVEIEIVMIQLDSKKEIIHQIVDTDLEDHHTEADPKIKKTAGDEISEEKKEKLLGKTTDLTRVEVHTLF